MSEYGSFTGAIVEPLAAALRGGVAARGRASLAVPGGRTAGPVFDKLATADVPWAKVIITLVDDRWVSEDSPDSNAGLVKRRLLVGPAAEARFLPLKHGRPTPEEDAQEASRALIALGLPLDAVLLGMGEDGHVASLFPGSPVLEAGLFGDGVCIAVPPGSNGRPPSQPRLSLTLPVVAAARRIVLAVMGGGKEAALRRAKEGDDVTEMPVRALIRPCRPNLQVVATPLEFD